jgi:hypothetical protein
VNAIVPINAAPSLPIADVERVALAIAKGGLFGSTDPNAVLTLCLLAQAEGQHPAVVFRDYHIIKGKPAKKADAMLRDFVTAGGKVDWHTLDDTIADATFSHPYGGTVRIDWTMDRARTAGLATDMWRKYPRQMLRSRVISEGVRTVYPGATSGLYEVGEVQDIVGESGPAQTETPEQQVIQHTPATEAAEPARPRAVPLTGPIKTRAEIRVACGNFVRDLNACADADMVAVVLADNADLIEQVEREVPFYWEGDGADFKGMKMEIELAKIAFDDSWKTDVTRAG